MLWLLVLDSIQPSLLLKFIFKFGTFQGVKECIPCLFKFNLSISIIKGSGYALLKVKVIWCTCVVHFGRCEKVEDSNFML